MNGYIEILEDSYDDTLEHLNRIKLIACKLIKMLSQESDIYGENDEPMKTHKLRVNKHLDRYNY